MSSLALATPSPRSPRACSTAVSLKSVEKCFPDGTRGIDSVDLEIPEGEFCVLLGPSGAGKSTLLKTINWLVKPTGGSIEIFGEAITAHNLRECRDQIGMIHQHYGLVPRSSVELNILSGALARASAWRILLQLFPADLRRRAAELASAVGLTEAQFRRRASSLSGGQQQRVGIARAFLLDPRIVLADEPVASLDPRVSREVLALLKEHATQRGSTVICSLHQPDLAREFGDRIIGIKKGKVFFDVTSSELTEERLKNLYYEYDSRA